ncbi:hypothetical protein BpHYR1_046926 [Brachionus plicatilis]|uniref:Uncharacterized protein n=1 Tax=Brachionus plicatilis TaxID=10195 RepID=A0A3M7S5J8_BRAPC|nr:hypothetical protein BpHYR1_046926 [Brachionus plicatilis]
MKTHSLLLNQYNLQNTVKIYSIRCKFTKAFSAFFGAPYLGLFQNYPVNKEYIDTRITDELSKYFTPANLALELGTALG